MTPEQNKRAKEFFASLAAAGITQALTLCPPPGADVKVVINADGSLSENPKRRSDADQQDYNKEIERAQEVANQQDPKTLGGIFRYPLNAALHFDPSIFAAEEPVKDIPIIHAEFCFVRGAWIFEDVKGI